jgi:hypothetical protein
MQYFNNINQNMLLMRIVSTKVRAIRIISISGSIERMAIQSGVDVIHHMFFVPLIKVDMEEQIAEEWHGITYQSSVERPQVLFLERGNISNLELFISCLTDVPYILLSVIIMESKGGSVLNYVWDGMFVKDSYCMFDPPTDCHSFENKCNNELECRTHVSRPSKILIMIRKVTKQGFGTLNSKNHVSVRMMNSIHSENKDRLCARSKVVLRITNGHCVAS